METYHFQKIARCRCHSFRIWAIHDVDLWLVGRRRVGLALISHSWWESLSTRDNQINGRAIISQICTTVNKLIQYYSDAGNCVRHQENWLSSGLNFRIPLSALVSGFFVGGNMKPKLLRVDQVLELLNISRGKLYRLLKNEPLFPRPIKLGGMLYFIPEEIDEFINLQRRVER